MDGLTARGLTKRFGGVVALDGVSFDAPLGQITGLIGPNGAGKTTTFDLCSGLQQPTAGTVHLFGVDVTATDPAKRARAGLGRTFQRTQLCDSLSVRDNVALGLEARLAGRRLLRQIFVPRAERSALLEATEGALARCGLTDLAGRRTGDLSIGQRRLVELARVIAGGFRMLLLDEPSSGLDAGETVQFGQTVRSAVMESGGGALVVEHDMSLVQAVCDRLFLLDFGAIVLSGPPAEVLSSPVVRAAYLGDAEPVGDPT